MSLESEADEEIAVISTGGNEQFQSELSILRSAIVDLRIGDMDKSVDAINKSALSEEDRAAAKTISKRLLMGEYDEAVELIDQFT